MTANQATGERTDAGERALPLLFTPLTIKDVTLRNRIVVAPTSLFTCDSLDGLPGAFHMQHLGSRALGGAGLVLTEAAAVSSEGRTCLEDLGFWSDAHGEAFAPIVEFGQKRGAKMGVQLFHGGRRTSTDRANAAPLPPERGGWIPMGPSPVAAMGGRYGEPREMTREDIKRLARCYGEAAARAHRYGFDVVELHSCHGYLLAQFLSPTANFREDEYGGSWENRTRFTLEAADAIRANWPESKPFFVRLSGTEWVPEGWQTEEMVRLAAALIEHGVDVIDCSAGAGNAWDTNPKIEPGYLVQFSERVRREVGCLTTTVGLITTAQLANEVLEDGRADMVNISRAFVRDPYFGIRCAEALGCPDAMPWPPEYTRAVADLVRFGL